MTSHTVGTRIPLKLKKELEDISRLERRNVSAILRIALENFVEQYTKLHPQFRADILEAMEGVKRGEVEPYTYG